MESSKSSRRRAPPTATDYPVVVRVHSEERKQRQAEEERKQKLRKKERAGGSSSSIKKKQQERQLAAQTALSKELGNVSDIRRVVFLCVCTVVLCFSLMSIVSVKWTRSSVKILENTGNIWPSGSAEFRTEVGLFSLCNCTSLSDSTNSEVCPRVKNLAIGVRATGVLALLFQAGSLVMFLCTTYITLNKKLELATIGLWLLAFTFSLVSWAVQASFRTNSTCPLTNSGAAGNAVIVSSYADLDFSHHWAFGIRIVESMLCLAVSGFLAARYKGKLGAWPVAFVIQILILALSSCTVASNHWLQQNHESDKISAQLLLDPGATGDVEGGSRRIVGPWNDCRCVSITTICPEVAHQFRGAQAFTIMTLLLLAVQILLCTTVPSLLPQIPEVAVVGFAWSTWLFMCISWSLALSALTDCRCNPQYTAQGSTTNMQLFGWPFPIAFLGFLAETAVAVFVSYQYGKKRLLLWASDLHRMADGDQPVTSTSTGTLSTGGGGGESAGGGGGASKYKKSSRRSTSASSSLSGFESVYEGASGDEGGGMTTSDEQDPQQDPSMYDGRKEPSRVVVPSTHKSRFSSRTSNATTRVSSSHSSAPTASTYSSSNGTTRTGGASSPTSISRKRRQEPFS